MLLVVGDGVGGVGGVGVGVVGDVVAAAVAVGVDVDTVGVGCVDVEIGGHSKVVGVVDSEEQIEVEFDYAVIYFH